MSIPANIVSPSLNVMAQVRGEGREWVTQKDTIRSLDLFGARALLYYGENSWR
jgi:hypothetical protein